MAIILNIETATDHCFVAIGKDGRLLAEASSSEPYSHAARLTLLIQQCLKTADLQMEQLDALAVSAGPGSYTGLRIGSSTAKGICYALDKPLIAIPTLDALAWASIQDQEQRAAIYIPMIDARRMEVYAAGYDQSMKITFSSRPIIVNADSFAEELSSGLAIVLSGNGAEKCREILTDSRIHYSRIYCDAAHLIALAEEAFQQGQFVDLAYFSPSYLKQPNITKPKNIL